MMIAGLALRNLDDVVKAENVVPERASSKHYDPNIRQEQPSGEVGIVGLENDRANQVSYMFCLLDLYLTV
jgi:hypothetical protein